MNIAQETIDAIKKIVRATLKEYNINQQIHHYGTVERVNGDNTVNIHIDGAEEIKRNVRCNPDVVFKETDKVIVLYINGNSKSPFVLCRRG